MKVVLRKSVPPHGASGAIVDVGDAYARNFLIPKGLAVPATEKAMADASAKSAQQASAKQKQRTESDAAKTKVQGQVVKLQAPATAGQRLYQGLHQDEIIRAIERQVGVRLHGVTLRPASLKSVGPQTVEVRWPDQTAVTLTVEVVTKS